MATTILLGVVWVFCVSIFGAIFDPRAAQAFSGIITYQGKLADSTGVAVADGTYSIKFTFYSAASGGSCQYTASGTCGTPTALSVTVTDGLFTVNFGGSGTNAIDPTIFQSGDLYLGVTVASDAEMTPRKQLTNVGFAYNALYLSGLATSTVGGTGSFIPAADSNGNFVFTGTPQSSGVSGGVLYINPASATSDFTLLGVAVGGTSKFRVGEDGDTVLAGSLTVGTTLSVGGDITPSTNNSYDLGSHTSAFTDIFASGTTYTNNLTILGTCTGCGNAGLTDNGTVINLTTDTDNLAFGTSSANGLMHLQSVVDESPLVITATSTQTTHLTRWHSVSSDVPVAYITAAGSIRTSSTLHVTGNSNFYTQMFIDPNATVGTGTALLNLGTNADLAGEHTLLIRRAQNVGNSQGQIGIQDSNTNGGILTFGYDDTGASDSTQLAWISSYYTTPGLTATDLDIDAARIRLLGHSNGAHGTVSLTTPAVTITNADDNIAPILALEEDTTDRLYIYATDTKEVLFRSLVTDQAGVAAFVFDTNSTLTSAENRSLLMVRNNATERFSISGNGNFFTSGTAYLANLSVSDNLASNLIPDTNNTYDLGSPSRSFNDLYASGTVHLGISTNIPMVMVDTASGIVGIASSTLSNRPSNNVKLEVNGEVFSNGVIIAGGTGYAINFDADGIINTTPTNSAGATNAALNIIANNEVDQARLLRFATTTPGSGQVNNILEIDYDLLSAAHATTSFISYVKNIAGATAFHFNTNASLTSSSVALDRTLLTVSNNGVPKFHIGAGGNVYAKNSFIANSTDFGIGDLAEYIDLTPGQSVASGDVITPDPKNPGKFVKVTEAYSSSVAGIVSNTAAFVMGASGDNRAALALAGIVYARVSDENGPIAVGDMLVTAGEAGHLMKYNPEQAPSRNAVIVATAIEPHETGLGSIKVLVRAAAYTGGSKLTVAERTDGTLAAASESTLIASSITSTRGTWSVDEDGKLKVRRITAQEYVVEHNDSSPTIGEGVMETGEYFKRVKTPAVGEHSKIFVSFLTNLGGRSYHISEKIPGDSFTIMVSSPVSEFTYFDWWIVQREGDIEQLTAEPAPPVPFGEAGDEQQTDVANPSGTTLEEPIPTFEELAEQNPRTTSTPQIVPSSESGNVENENIEEPKPSDQKPEQEAQAEQPEDEPEQQPESAIEQNAGENPALADAARNIETESEPDNPTPPETQQPPQQPEEQPPTSALEPESAPARTSSTPQP